MIAWRLLAKSARCNASIVLATARPTVLAHESGILAGNPHSTVVDNVMSWAARSDGSVSSTTPKRPSFALTRATLEWNGDPPTPRWFDGGHR
jgi:hypothetical protein